MRWIQYTVIGFILLLFENTLGNYVSIGSHYPDMLLLLVIVISLRSGRVKGTLAGFIIGFTQDIYMATDFLGVSPFAKSIVGFTVGHFSERFRSTKIPGVFIPITLGIFINFTVRVMFYSPGSEAG